MIGVAVLMVERQARRRMEIAILACFKTPILSHQVSQHTTNRSDWSQPPRRVVGRELSSEPAFGAGSPVRFVVRGKFGPGGWLRWLRRHLPPDVGRRLVRTSAALSSDH